jgi:hypothetical protein
MAGTGSALMGMMQMLMGALGGYAVNALYDGTPLPMTGLARFSSRPSPARSFRCF